VTDSSVKNSPNAATELAPPALGVVRLRVPAFARLTRSEQLQAAALALTRDLGITDGLRIAAIAIADSPDEAAVAYCVSRTDSPATPHATRLLGLMQPSKMFWINAPHGYIVGERGAAAVESTDPPSAASATASTLPSVVAAMLGAVSNAAKAQCILVNRDRTALTEETLAYWRAASGVDFADGALPDTSAVELVVPPKSRVSPQITSLDRALRWCAAGALACAVLAGVQFALTQKSAARVPGTQTIAQGPGALFERIATVAPDVPANLQSATFAGEAWVLVLADATDAAAVSRVTKILEANGFAVQSTRVPSPRLRVALP